MARADLVGWKIGIDPGHGGWDPGAVGPTGLQEKEVNLDASFGLRHFLTGAGAEALMTRTTDIYLSLSARANFMNSNDVDRSICVHHNSVSSPDPNFHLTYVAVGYGWATAGDLAYDIAQRVTEFNGLGFGWSNCGREGVYEENFYMVVYTYMPSVLPEISFISNPWEEQRLYNDRYCYGNGRGMYCGVMDHLGGWEEGASNFNYPASQAQAPSSSLKDAGEGGITILQVSPNPFNSRTTIRFELPAASRVKLTVYNIKGRIAAQQKSATLVDGWREAGIQEVTFEESGLPSGVYIYQLKTDTSTITGKIVLLK